MAKAKQRAEEINLEDFVLREDADLVGLSKTVLKTMEELFPKQKFVQYLIGDDDEKYCGSGPNYIKTLQALQLLRQAGTQKWFGLDTIVIVDAKRESLGYMFLNYRDIIMVDDSEPITQKQERRLYEALKPYIKKKD